MVSKALDGRCTDCGCTVEQSRERDEGKIEVVPEGGWRCGWCARIATEATPLSGTCARCARTVTEVARAFTQAVTRGERRKEEVAIVAVTGPGPECVWVCAWCWEGWTGTAKAAKEGGAA